MKVLDKLRDSLANKAVEAVAASLTVLLAWAAYQIAPSILPAIEAAVSKPVLLAILVASAILNLIFLLVVWYLAKSDGLRLKYGIYWDRHKNPHCPSCKKPLSAYDKYRYSGNGYYCKTPCNKVFPIADASGKRYEPAEILSEL